MTAKILHFKQNRHTTTGNQMIVSVEGVSDREQAAAYVGKTVIYTTKNGQTTGEVASPHGNSGKLRVRFERGMPGQAIGSAVTIQ